ncbi:N-acetyltransferase family protein [Aquipuribacter sp. MA13-6]|uniref:GNAT family N-acetyltransferase n=1 Tax=unclassified Aquipuribacter TaxID=2635084 RepID=UPI003EED2CBF
MTTTAQLLPVDPASPHFPGLVRLMEDVDRETVGDDAYEPYDVDYEKASWLSANGHNAGWVVVADGTVVAFAKAFMPDRDNTHVVELEIGVAAGHRGRGHGRALLQVVSDHARSEGRDTLLSGTGYRPDPDAAWALHELAVADESLTRRPTPGAVLGVSFARASGADLVQTELRSQVRLPVPAQVLARQDAEVAAHADGCTTRTWTGACPDDLLADRAALAARMDTDPPLGDMDWRPGVWDADRMRDTYADWARRGLLVVGAGAVSPEGRLVAFSEMGQDRRHPAMASQFDTIVDPDHRGRRLGMLVKQAALRALGEAAPQVERVQTWNALENGPMLRVNRAMGFVPVGLYALWQLKLT